MSELGFLEHRSSMTKSKTFSDILERELEFLVGTNPGR